MSLLFSTTTDQQPNNNRIPIVCYDHPFPTGFFPAYRLHIVATIYLGILFGREIIEEDLA